MTARSEAVSSVPTFVCPLCHKQSWSEDDAVNRYCGACHVYTGDAVWTDYGLRLKLSACGLYYIGVRPMLVNWRLVLSQVEREWWPEGEWCYAGRDRAAFVTAALAGLAWDGDPSTEPLGWSKNVRTGEWRPPAEVSRVD
ncbi:MAG TPA: hypothetical protein VFW65_31865 [Pseudonocardiaceae bacterium]|nr:hypothetical protein [Pseudonocardiaceae bacterium]